MALVRKELLDELEQIIKEEYCLELSQKEVSNVGNSLVQYFETLIKINQIYETQGGQND